MLAFIGNLSLVEIVLVLVIAVLIFGRRLPQVAAQVVQQIVKLRRSLETLWRETGLAEEWRGLQRGVDQVRRFEPLPGPPRRRGHGRPALPDQRAAEEAAELAREREPGLSVAPQEGGPPAEEAWREGAETEARGAGEPSAQDTGAQLWRRGKTRSAGADAPEPGSGSGPDEEPDPGAPEGSLPRS